MKTETTTASELRKVLARIIKDVDHKSTMEVLRGILFQKKIKGSLTLCASNITTTVRYTVSVKTKGAGKWSAVAMNPRLLLKWLNATRKDSPVEISLQDDRLVFVRNGKRLSMRTLPATDFPETKPERKWGLLFAMRMDDLHRWGGVLSRTMSDDETRPYLYGVGIQEGHLGSTDGHRLHLLNLHKLEKAKDTAKGMDGSCMIPADAWKRIVAEAKVIGTGTAEFYYCQVEGSQDMLLVSTDHARIVRLPESKPPPYLQVMPPKNKLTFKPDVEFLSGVVNEIVAIMGSDRIHYVEWQCHKGRAHLIYEVPGDVEYQTDVPGVWNKQKHFRIGIDCRYMKDALVSFENPILRFGCALDGVIFTERGNPLTAVVMPCKLLEVP